MLFDAVKRCRERRESLVKSKFSPGVTGAIRLRVGTSSYWSHPRWPPFEVSCGLDWDKYLTVRVS